ncbi:radical SAM (seleno)protein TrsS [Azospirillum sp. ST 5-10]|uniref:radical SAM (seleno)protein TrsS n=1 Tax=unclassified Azospirillum TaxID=2630922 RepID=UPI003F4A095D
MTLAAPRVFLGETESVCPECLATVSAWRFAEDDTVYLEKSCRAHGTVAVPVWRGLESYRLWGRGARAHARPPVCATAVRHGCPHDCGLCPDHRQQSCCVLLEVTSRCDLACPVCFASAGRHGRDADLAEIGGWLDTLAAAGGRVHIQLSGGEPTLRDDLPAIVRLVRARGFDFVQLNTNGVRIAREPDYLAALAGAGLDCVFLQFDGVSDETHRRLRGARLAELKARAVANCGAAGIGVVLVPTVAAGVNLHEIAAVVDCAKAAMPTVRAVHFQPISRFGRHPAALGALERVTLPEVMEALVAYSGGSIALGDFQPGSAENPYCSFSGRFLVDDDGTLRAERTARPSCCGVPAAAEAAKPSGCCGSTAPSPDVDRARRYVAGQWGRAAAGDGPAEGLEAFDTLLDRRRRTLGLSGMAFQDAWTFDVERVRQCHIHVVAPDRRVIPFCAYNLTDRQGRALYRATGR